ncbi:hypothetical protein B0H14DRAFT_3899628 [Mycena olivaceomarginata]|nr:hypothetical protein B0H14DRAFT_3899628 [Mycena olivaceomarginata]
MECSNLSNPDVSGIGVRAAIYAQNLTCFLPVIVHLWDRKISKDELKGIKDQSIGMLAVAFAILLTTIILAKGAGGNQTITSYHAAVVLDLSWMNNTSTWIWFILYVHHRSKRDDRRTEANWSAWRGALLEPVLELLGRNEKAGASTEDPSIAERIRGIAQRIWRFISGQPVLTLGSIHLSLMAAVGIWLWSDPSKFGQPLGPNCAPTLTVVGAPARLSSKPLRIASLIMYSLVLIPGVNLIPPFAFFLALHISYNWSRGRHLWRWTCVDKALGAISNVLRMALDTILHVLRLCRNPTSDIERQTPSKDANDRNSPSTSDPSPRTAFLIVGLVLLVAINILFIVDIELTLGRNKGDQNSDNEWGFGQVLALLLLIIPLRDAWGALQEIQEKIRERLKGFQEQFEELLQREFHATPVSLARSATNQFDVSCKCRGVPPARPTLTGPLLALRRITRKYRRVPPARPTLTGPSLALRRITRKCRRVPPARPTLTSPSLALRRITRKCRRPPAHPTLTGPLARSATNQADVTRKCRRTPNADWSLARSATNQAAQATLRGYVQRDKVS